MGSQDYMALGYFLSFCRRVHHFLKWSSHHLVWRLCVFCGGILTEKIPLKRQAVQPKAGYTVSYSGEIETIQAIPFVDLV